MYNCSHIKHNKSKHRLTKVDGKRPASTVKARLEIFEMDGSDQNPRSDPNSVKPDSSLNRASGSKLPLNSPDNTDHLFVCPGCRKDFKLFSGFVLHIENRSCKSQMCHEIEDRINKCALELFHTFPSEGFWTRSLVSDIFCKPRWWSPLWQISVILGGCNTGQGPLLLRWPWSVF